MRLRLRQVALPALLILCGVLTLSVPSQAAKRGRAVQRSATGGQQVEATSQQPVRQADVVHTVWNAIKFQIGSWFGISAPPVENPSDDHSNGPQYDGTDPKTRLHYNDAVYYDHGGEGGVQ